MSRYGQRPENALKRANEFIEVGKPARALDTLYEVFRNKKWAYSWSESVLEPIMFKYLDLCVELKKSHIAKEGLFQYRNMCQSVNVASLEHVVRGYLRMAEERTEQAREQSQQAIVDIDDLDNLATPESLLLSAVSGEDAQDRSDRTILTPWVKFLWESYCQCLELLRTNAHVENLYHDIAQMAFKFCLKYNRKTEFRKLCDKLRKHLEDILKLPPQAANVSLQRQETQQLNLETRLAQLESAITMELWQEAYKAIEDIHGLMALSKKMPLAKTMANYYQKLAMVFWKAGNQLFHAAALFKLFQLSREMKKNITTEELQKMASRVLVATLAVPLPSAHPEFDRFIETDKSPLEKAQKLAVLLGLSQPPSRAALIRDLVRFNVVANSTPVLQDLYQWLEVEFHPLQLCGRVQIVLDVLAGKGHEEGTYPLAQYIPALQDVTLVRLVRQVAQVYQTIEFNRLIQLAKFTTAFHLERILVDLVRHNDMQIRIDHRSSCVHFGKDLSESQREDLPEGPSLQSMPSEQVRNQLINMASVLHQAVNVISPQGKKIEREELRTQMVAVYHQTKERDHQQILQRHKYIEERKEYLERINTEREEEEARQQEELLRQQMLAEQKRLEHEREERERRRQESEIQQIRERQMKEKMSQMQQTSIGQRLIKKIEEKEFENLDADQLMKRQAEELEKEKRELAQKLKSQEKKFDFIERAKRLEEIPLLQKAIEEKQIQDREFWELQEKERIQQLIEERNLALEHSKRLKRMYADRDVFVSTLRAERHSIYVEKLAEFEKTLEKERKKRLAERKAKRKEQRRDDWIKERMELVRKKEEEEQRKLEEEREKQRKVDEEKRKEEELTRRKELEALNESQRKTDMEFDEREEKRRADSRPPDEDVNRPWRRGGDRAADETRRWGRDDDRREEPRNWGRRDDEGRERPDEVRTWRKDDESRDRPEEPRKWRRDGDDNRDPEKRPDDVDKDRAQLRRSDMPWKPSVRWGQDSDAGRRDDRSGRREPDFGRKRDLDRKPEEPRPWRARAEQESEDPDRERRSFRDNPPMRRDGVWGDRGGSRDERGGRGDDRSSLRTWGRDRDGDRDRDFRGADRDRGSGRDDRRFAASRSEGRRAPDQDWRSAPRENAEQDRGPRRVDPPRDRERRGPTEDLRRSEDRKGERDERPARGGFERPKDREQPKDEGGSEGDWETVKRH